MQSVTAAHAHIALRGTLLSFLGALAVTPWSAGTATALWLLSLGFTCTFRILYRRAQQVYVIHHGIKVMYLHERQNVWSSHFDGYPLRWWSGLWLRVTGRARRGIRLLDSREDRAKLEELALAAFAAKLDELQHQEGAIVISASVLNWGDRSTERLRRRIECVRARSVWECSVVRRRLNIAETIFGRLLYAWPVREGESYFHADAVGVMAYRPPADHHQPELEIDHG